MKYIQRWLHKRWIMKNWQKSENFAKVMCNAIAGERRWGYYTNTYPTGTISEYYK